MKSNKFSITITDHEDKEKLVAEIGLYEEFWAEISQENNLPLLKIYPPEEDLDCEFRFSEFLDSLKAGKKRLDDLNEENASFTYVFDDATENPLDIDTSSWLLSCYPLDFNKTLPYVTCYLKGKKSLSAALQNIDFSKGRFFTLLPEGVKEGSLYKFTDADLLPSEKWPSRPNQSFATIVFEKNNWVKIPTIRLLRKWMIERNESFICESIVTKFSDIKEEVYHETALHFNDELYYRVNYPKNDWWLLRESFYWGSSPDFVGILFNEEKGVIEGSKIQEGAFDKMAKSASLVLVGAYHHESYIFWQKDPFDLHSIGIEEIK